MKEYFISYKAAMNAFSELSNSDGAKYNTAYWRGVVDAEAAIVRLLLDDNACIMIDAEEKGEAQK